MCYFSKSIHYVLLSAAVFAGFTLFTSCYPQVAGIADTMPTTIQVSPTDFDISVHGITRATTQDIPSNLNRCAIKVFNEAGEEVASFSQTAENLSQAVCTGHAAMSEDTSFGKLQLTLVPGIYTFVCVMNEAKASSAEALAAIAPATITSATVATIPGTAARDTYCCAQQLLITNGTTSVSLPMGDRINSRFKLSVSDAVPAEVSTLAIIISPQADAPSGSLSINPTTGFATSSLRYMGAKSVSGSVPDSQIDLYLPESPFSTTVRLEGRNSSGTALYTRTLNVQFEPNQVNHATGRLFDSAQTRNGFTFAGNDWTTTSIAF